MKGRSVVGNKIHCNQSKHLVLTAQKAAGGEVYLWSLRAATLQLAHSLESRQKRVRNIAREKMQSRTQSDRSGSLSGGAKHHSNDNTQACELHSAKASSSPAAETRTFVGTGREWDKTLFLAKHLPGTSGFVVSSRLFL